MTTPVLLIDGMNIIHRSYHGQTYGGRQPNASAISGLALSHIVDWVGSRNGTVEHTHVVFDGLGDCRAARRMVYPPYKADRAEHPPEIEEAVGRLALRLEERGFQTHRHAHQEADDVLATMAFNAAPWHRLHTEILTSDKDLYQVLDDDLLVEVHDPQRKKWGAFQNAGTFKVNWKFSPHLLPDFKALKGDDSDHISGIIGVGKGMATDLIVAFGPVERIYAHLGVLSKNQRRLLEGREERALAMKRCATVDRDLPCVAGWVP